MLILYRKISLITFLLVTVGTYIALCQECTQRDPCACEMNDGSGIIDISSLGNHDHTPRFKDVKYADDMGSMYFSYNPCGGFDEGTCSNAATCSYMKEPSTYQQIGNAGTGRFVFLEGSKEAIIAYAAPSSKEQIWSYVTLICDPTACEPVFVPKSSGLHSTGPNAVYQMEMTSVCGCPGMCDENGASSCKGANSGAISGGLIFLIAFFSILVIYIVGGVLFMKVGRKATGTDVIPNKAVWTSLPGLVWDGFKFTFCRCKSGGRTYTNI